MGLVLICIVSVRTKPDTGHLVNGRNGCWVKKKYISVVISVVRTVQRTTSPALFMN